MKKGLKFGCLGIIALIVLIIIIGSLVGDDKETINNSDVNQETGTDRNANNNKEEFKERAKEEKVVPQAIKAGTYKVGTDIKSGEYLIFSEGFGYVEAAKDSTGNLESIVFNANLTEDSHTYATLSDGLYFKLQGAKMYPVAEAPSVIPENGVYKDGMYKVGQDIPAGEYKIILESEAGMGYIEVAKDSSYDLDSIVTNENLQADTYLTVQDGQYLTLQGAKIEIE
ncbi:hypothetical protein ACIQ34_09135 [Ureibacillus sp. NPDC094379]